MSKYFTIKNITAGFFIAFLSAGAMYLDWLGFINYFINTILGISALYFLLTGNKKRWVWTGFWIGILWFWWIGISFKNYDMAWAIPLPILGLGFIYMSIFWGTLSLVEFFGRFLPMKQGQRHGSAPTGFDMLAKAVILLLLSYIHPFGFDWFKPELMFTNSYLGIEKWQFGLVLLALILSLYKKQLFYLLLILLAHPFTAHFEEKKDINPKITLYNTHTTVQDKWNEKLISKHVDEVFVAIREAIDKEQTVIVFPESIFAFFVNMQPQIMEDLQHYSNKIIIVVGGLYWDNTIPRNSTYIFKEGSHQIANKVKLVPFGEKNPLPSWMGSWVNKIFFDGAPDYVASADFTDYTIDGVHYRNAICFEATSEKLYEGKPKNMIVLSNNGWFTPSIESTQQKILLQYYNKKYGTTIYHSVNMSDSYTVNNGEVIK
ncbi:apolipoprotein N-acyltransferase [bacterium]|nr:apolipoprotein N-acyltransferase [bacterium]MBU1958781.1 apolipoprotein N-acyltransferase [bacterium]